MHVMQRKLNGRIKCTRRKVSWVEAWLKVTQNKNQVPWFLFWCDVRATSPPFLSSFWFFLIWLRARLENGAAFIMEFQRTAADVSGKEIWCNKIYDVRGCGGKWLGGLQKKNLKQNQSSPASCFSVFLFFNRMMWFVKEHFADNAHASERIRFIEPVYLRKCI